MARNGSGTMDITGADLTNGTLADATAVQAKFDDIETALTASIAKDGQTTPTASLPMGGFNHTNVGVATARTHYARASQVADGSLTYGGVATGTADALAIAPSPAITAYAIGQQFQFKVGSSANTGAATLNVNSVGAGSITWPDGTALAAGDLPANSMVVVVVQATTPVFHLVSKMQAGAPTASISNAMLANMAAFRIKGRVSSTGAPQDLTATQVLSNLMGTTAKLIGGWTYANNGSDATNDLDIAAGSGMDATGAYWIATSALTKQSDVAWAVGTNAGGLDTGAVGNNDYYIWAIARSDTGVTDILFSLSSTAPTMPTNYDFKRLVGWFKRVSATIVPFTTRELEGGGIEMKWTTPTLDIDTSTLTTSRATNALKVPLNFKTEALVRTLIANNSSACTAWVGDPAETDAAPSLTATPLATHYVATSAVDVDVKDQRILTSATGTIAARSTAASTIFRALTEGFQWSRR